MIQNKEFKNTLRSASLMTECGVRVPDDTAPAGETPDGLPTWDLTDLYPSPDAESLSADRAWLAEECADFKRKYAGALATLGADDWLACILRFERIQSTSGRIVSYAELRQALDLTDSARTKFLSDMEAEVTDASSSLVFFLLEINGIDESRLSALLTENAELARFRPYFDHVRALKPHQLSDELETFLNDQSVVGASAWSRLFDETVGAFEFDVDSRILSLEATIHLMSDPDRTIRETAAKALARGFTDRLPLFARITNTLVKSKEIEDRWRRLPAPQSARHLANRIDPGIVATLRDTVVSAYPEISHRYYRLKARWLGLDTLEIWDRNAPLPEAEDRTIGWNEARRIVVDAYAAFSPEMATASEPFFERGWIDAAPAPGKSPGAFSDPTVVDVHPYILLNYQGRQRDVMVLAHELGHGVHQRLAAKQGELLSSTPLTLAETASVFGEMLTFRALLDAARTPSERKSLLAGKVEDMINTVIRQIAFYDFECRIHRDRRKGELVPDTINATWLAVQSESLGPAFTFMDGYEAFWTYVPHFIHSPFYVYAYAFGECLVNSLYSVYQDSESDFVPHYLDMLAAGGSRTLSELLAAFDLDASDPAFWSKGLSVISGFIDELEALEE